MQTPTTLTFRHIERTAALESRAYELSGRLQRFNERIMWCHITIEGRPNAQAHDALYSVKIHLSVPGAQIHADSVQGGGAEPRDVHAALRDAYENAKRQLDKLQQDSAHRAVHR